MSLLTLNLSCENVKYPARKHFEKTNTTIFSYLDHNQAIKIEILHDNILSASDTIQNYNIKNLG